MLIYIDGEMRTRETANGVRLRPRAAVRRRRLRGHPRLQPPHLPARRPSRSARTPRRGRIALDIPLTRAAMRGGGAARRCASTAGGRLHPAGRHPRRRVTSASIRTTCPRPTRDHHRRPTSRCIRRALYASGIRVITSATRQVSHEAVDPRIKSLNYLKNVLAKIDAAAGRRARGDHAERRTASSPSAPPTTSSSVRRGTTLLTPSPQDGALDGITRAAVPSSSPPRRGSRRARRGSRATTCTPPTSASSPAPAPRSCRWSRSTVVRSATGRPAGSRDDSSEAFHALARSEGEPVW